MLGGVAVLALFFVGWDVTTRFLFPGMSTAARHVLLTVWAAMVTGVATATVYLLGRRWQRRLTATAQRLSQLIESYQDNPMNPGRFENPNLVHCASVLGCKNSQCPMHSLPDERCWQVMAVPRSTYDDVTPWIELSRCTNCEVYRLSCPDELTELGESFNNLMFLLKAGSQRLDRMRGQMLEKERIVAIGQMAAGIAHEVCNPLSSISSVVQVLKRRNIGEQMPEELDLIETHIRRITGTVRRLVSLAHPGPDRWERVDVGATLENALRLVAFDRRARKVRIDWSPPSTQITTFALRDQLQQVIINLMLNAFDAMPGGGTLAISARENSGHMVIEVADTGCGIPPEIGRRVFDPFFTTKSQGQGTGLGLAVSYGIVQRHRGAISFTSKDGEGTVFKVELPILTQPPDEIE